MDTRYLHPQIAELWSPEWTYEAWFKIERAVLTEQLRLKLLPECAEHDTLTILTGEVQPNFRDGWNLTGIRAYEEQDKHDVAALVRWLRDWYGEPHGRWLHHGLTSSDLVDTTQGMRFRRMEDLLWGLRHELVTQLRSWEDSRAMVVGRTHGEPAEPMTMGMRAAHWAELIRPALAQLGGDTEGMQVCKLSGPVGSFAHNSPKIEAAVAAKFGLKAQGRGASQIVPRNSLARWANSASELVQACAKIGVDVRLMLLLGEAGEIRPAGQVGSSSMAHKTNPIRAEQLTGLVRLAAGYASMLQPVDLWLERDISHSCVERVAVPDLWHVVFHAIKQTTELLRTLLVNDTRDSLERNANKLYVHHNTLRCVRDGMDMEPAREHALQVDVESYDIEGDMRRDFAANYPKRG